MRFGLVVLLVFFSSGCSQQTPPRAGVTSDSSASGLRFLQGGEGEGFARATEAREFRFPDDHGSHPEYRSEWWYLTGNLASPSGQRFGLQVTFFRFGLTAVPPDRSGSEWRASQAWMAHIAVADATGGRFIARERMARDALGLAGSESVGLGLRVEDWSLVARSLGGATTWGVEASDADMAVEVTAVGDSSGVIAQGEGGLDRKGPEPGNASYYYSMPGLRVSGRLRVGSEDVPVSGIGWLDREWGTSALSAGIEGWDWFALQLDDGSKLMYYRLRRSGGVGDPFSSGVLISTDGESVRLGADDVALRPTEWWQSDSSLVRYPIAWELEVPTRQLALGVRALLPQQELDLSVRYWEGAVDVGGSRDGVGLRGQGYLELTGYGNDRR